MSLWAVSATEHLKGLTKTKQRRYRTWRSVSSRQGSNNQQLCGPLLYRKMTYFPSSILVLICIGVDLRRGEPVLRFLWPLLSADGNQRPRSSLFSGAIWDSGAGFPAALQLHRLEPLRHRHRPGYTERARYTLRSDSRQTLLEMLMWFFFQSLLWRGAD